MKYPFRWLALFVSLSLCLSFLACAKEEGTDAESESSAESAPSVEEETGMDPTEEFLRYFDLSGEENELLLSTLTQYEGEIEAVDGKNHLMAIRTRDLDVKNQVVDTVSVYDMKSGALIRSEQVANSLGSAETVKLSVEIDYPVLRVIRATEGSATTYEVSHYLAKKDGALLHTTTRYIPMEEKPKTAYGNGLVSYNMGEVILWIDRNMETVRTVDAIAAGGYELAQYNSEYQGYLYTWNEETLQVFNRLGVMSGSYTIPHRGELNVHVLDDGNVLIQDLWAVDEHTASTLTLGNTRYKLTSYIMSYLDGSLTEVSLDFLVDTLQTAYSERYGETGGNVLPFRLASGDNQAILYRFANGRLSVYGEYAVLGNDLSVLYTVPNTTDGVDLKRAVPLGETLYAAPVSEGGGERSYVFDAEGKILTPFGGAMVTKSFLVTEQGVYDHRMTRLVDLSTDDYAGSLFAVDASGDRIYLKIYSFALGREEAYVYDGSAEGLRLLSDGEKESLFLCSDGFYVLHRKETDEYCFCTREGETVLTVYGEHELTRCEDALLVETVFEGKPITYVLG